MVSAGLTRRERRPQLLGCERLYFFHPSAAAAVVGHHVAVGAAATSSRGEKSRRPLGQRIVPARAPDDLQSGADLRKRHDTTNATLARIVLDRFGETADGLARAPYAKHGVPDMIAYLKKTAA